ncbi:hypothetical protein CDO87_14150 [Sagittula sp. P11]|uniref:phage protease n=1 Tax=Sagittula sp. P11 TaxID=2009329 RepID=UPI000C2CF808|nr:phage protease [Sagittula sp. P11]AUC54247.1 hypothetical protein CDO87_14150 [Sagittula sp. P11]
MNTSLVTSPLAAIELTEAGQGAPEWIHILPPAGQPFRSIDGRGPWHYDDPDELIRASFAAEGPRLFVDINHATTRVGPFGGEAPSYGEITEMQSRETGIWARVEWSRKGAELMADRAYRGVSPVILSNKKTGKLSRVWHVSLTNTPALGGAITSLSKEDPEMNLSAIAKALGLGEDATEEEILAAIRDMKATATTDDLSVLVTALGANEDATVSELAVLARSLVSNAKSGDRVEELSEQLAEMKAEAFVEAQLAAGVGIKADFRDELIALHKEDPARAARVCAQLPKLGRIKPTTPGPQEQISELTVDQRQIADQLGIAHDKYLASLQADAKAQEA